MIPMDSNINYNYLYEVVISTDVLRASGTTAKVQIVLEGELKVYSSSCCKCTSQIRPETMGGRLV